jgi:hypothetical protein
MSRDLPGKIIALSDQTVKRAGIDRSTEMVVDLVGVERGHRAGSS